MESERVVQQSAVTPGKTTATTTYVEPATGKTVEQKATVVSVGKTDATAMSVEKAQAENSSEAEKDVLDETSDAALMYLQSVLLYNVPAHFIALSSSLFLLVSWGDVVVAHLNFFQLAGMFMVVLGVASALWSRRQEKRKRKKKNEKVPSKEELEQSLFAPQDATGADLMRAGDGVLKRLTRRVKLLPPNELRARLREYQQAARQALYAARILRFSHPTRFSISVSFLVLMFAMVASYFPGRILLHVMIQGMLWYPGLAARGFPELWRLWLRRRLGRGWADALLATHNLNLEETHTARVIAFVDAADAELAMKPRVVSAPISEQKAA